MAIISIPIEITANGDQITHTDLYKVDFTVIDYLPPPTKPLVEINLAELFSQIADNPSDELAFRNDAEETVSGSETFNDYPSDMDGSVSDITDNAEYPNYVSDVSDIESEPENEDLDDGFASESEVASFPDTEDNCSITYEDKSSPTATLTSLLSIHRTPTLVPRALLREGVLANTFYERPEQEQDQENETKKENEIAKHRTFPKSKTIRRTHPINNRTRFSRRTNNRIIHIPRHIIRALNL